MKTVMEFAENVLKFGRDRYHERPSPLFADGIDVNTGEHLKWVLPGGREVVVSNLACQQNLYRTLTALTNITGDPKYKEAAQTGLKYHFDYLADDSGLLQWGGHRFIDLLTLEPTGPGGKEMVHELKNAFPYYELMYEVNPEATIRFIKAFWNAHIIDWDELYLSRHGQYGLKLGPVWDHTPVNRPTFRESNGLSFINAGSDLIYAAGTLYRLNGDPKALNWAKHLAWQYVAARHPQTGLGAYQFTQPKQVAATTDDNITLSKFGDRAKRQFGPEFGSIALEGNVLFHKQGEKIYSENMLMQIQLAWEIAAAGSDLLEWSRQGLLSFAKYGYNGATNQIKPMFADGKDLTGYVLRRNGYYGKAGTALVREDADCKYLLTYARGFLYINDEKLWQTARSIAKGNSLGDLGVEPGRGLKINLETKCSDPKALFALVDLFRATSNSEYLRLGQVIAANIEKTYFHKGYFLKGREYRYARLDAVEPLALLALEAALRDEPDLVPVFINSSGYIGGDYQEPDGTVRNAYDREFYDLKQ